jgi:hypothetical protein
MKIGIISLAILLISSTALAQKTLITEIEPGNLWLHTGYSSSSTDMTFTEESTSNSTDSSTDNKEFSVSATKAFNVEGGATPLLELEAGSADSEGDSTSIYSAKLGIKFKPNADANLVVFAGYNGSSDGDVRRPEAIAGALFGLQEKDFYNELSVSASQPKKTSTLEGGNSIDIVNAIKFTPTQNFVLTGIFGLSLVNDITISNDIKMSPGPLFSFGGEAELFFNDKISAAFSIAKSIGDADTEYQSTKIEIDLDSTVVQFFLNARF